ncbi:uncharacterized protein LOC129601927 [Paramacrobiotus metropolitanus]|uniref:uncharacterized protein LOC129601927 n=1 Tax=Paramacrobiotus metropolitanus TaxID=2943436 RepID=UPI0024457454|nr:uncharacterized protein LOC129601927 [Paramacrobiotus metropolitanus]
MLLFVVTFLAGLSLCYGQCTVPYSTVKSALPSIDVNKVNGIWYEYCVNFDQVGWNILKNGTLRGAWPGEPSPQVKYGATFWINYYIPVDSAKNTPNDPMKCTAIWHHGNMTSMGKRYAMSVYGDITNQQMVNITTTIVYTDYTTIEIVQGCDDYPPPTNNICTQPMFWVFTRVKPPTLTAKQREFVNNAIDYYLKPLCSGFSKMKLSTWDLGMEPKLPPCNIAQGTPVAFPWPANSAAFQASMPAAIQQQPV